MHGLISCTLHSDCAAYYKGLCVCLSNNGFGGKRCPFYKTAEQVIKERNKSIDTLKRKKRYDLIEKYKPERFLKWGVNNGE